MRETGDPDSEWPDRIKEKEDTVSASASINSRGKQQELSSSPGPQHTPADLISDDPHSAALRKGDHLKGKQKAFVITVSS